jgi:hypothetical protein
MTFNRPMSIAMETHIDKAVKAVDSDAFCHGGDRHCAAHIGYDDVDVDPSTRAAIVMAAKEAKAQYLRIHPRARG